MRSFREGSRYFLQASHRRALRPGEVGQKSGPKLGPAHSSEFLRVAARNDTSPLFTRACADWISHLLLIAQDSKSRKWAHAETKESIIPRENQGFQNQVGHDLGQSAIEGEIDPFLAEAIRTCPMLSDDAKAQVMELLRHRSDHDNNVTPS